MEDEKVIVLWRQPNGGFSQQAPGKAVASTISDTALKRLAKQYNIFVLELRKDGKSIEVKKL